MRNKNYITPKGLLALQDEFRQLHGDERPKLVEVIAWAASNGDRSENGDYIYGKRRLRQIDSRLRFLGKRIEAAEVIDPSQLNSQTVVFGATVHIESEEGQILIYQIVGEDESNPKEGKISWKSPLATSLLGKKRGDEIAVKTPTQLTYYTLLKIEYI